MPLNVGYIELSCSDSDVVLRVYYDTAWLDANPDREDWASAPLVNGPRGWCLDITNHSGQLARMSVTNASTGAVTNINIAQGNPVTGGPPSGRSRTAAQMAQLGYLTRGDVGYFELACAR